MLHSSGFDAETPLATLPTCAARAAARPELAAPLLTLARDSPDSLLDLEAPLATHAAGPAPFNLRWALLAGSLCDLVLGTPAHAAPFWRALLECDSAPSLSGRIDLWGAQRAIDAREVSSDASGGVWASWLAAALLSGLLPAEREAVPQLVANACAARLGTVVAGSALPGSFQTAVAALDRSLGGGVAAVGAQMLAGALVSSLLAEQVRLCFSVLCTFVHNLVCVSTTAGACARAFRARSSKHGRWAGVPRQGLCGPVKRSAIDQQS